jgi:hypothetical protein
MKSTQCSYISSLNKEAVLNTIAAQNVKWHSSGICCGEINGDKVSIIYKSEPLNKLNYNAVFEGKVSEIPEGTIISGEIKSEPFAGCFLMLFRGLLIVFIGLGIVGFITSDDIDISLIAFPAVSALMFAFSIGLEKKATGDNTDAITKFFEKDLLARPFDN